MERVGHVVVGKHSNSVLNPSSPPAGLDLGDEFNQITHMEVQVLRPEGGVRMKSSVVSPSCAAAGCPPLQQRSHVVQRKEATAAVQLTSCPASFRLTDNYL